VCIQCRGDLEDEKERIRRGLLYPYVKDASAYHCPSDIRTRTTIRDGGMGGFRSYAIPFAAYGTSDVFGGPVVLSKKYWDIKSPASKYVFVPELDAHLSGSWMFHAYNEQWYSLLAIWHSRNRSTLGWADGHVESHRWQDKETLQLASSGMEWIKDKESAFPLTVYPDNVHTGEDVRFLSRGYPVKKLLPKPGP
jgi:prepilin-type processing-associated H-X9-DG protein